jgi:hypothetical protein
MTPTSAGSVPKVGANRANILLGILGAGIVIVILVLWLAPQKGLADLAERLRAVDPILYWLGIIAAMVLALGLIGRAVNQRWLGVLIDSTNTMSLSRLQVTLWTTLVLSSYLMLALPRVFGAMTPIDKLAKDDAMMQQCMKDKPAGFVPTVADCGGGALEITFPPELVLAMGISLTSFAGSHLIQSVKSNRQVDVTELDRKVNDAEAKARAARDVHEKAVTDSRQPAVDLKAAQDAFNQVEAELAKDPESAPLKVKRDMTRFALETRRAANQSAIDNLTQAAVDLDAAQKALDNTKKDAETARTQAEGVLHKKDSAAQASWNDLFRGNEISNYSQVDMGKVQMFFFTVIILLAYGAAVAALLRSGTAMLNPLGIGYPPFSDSLNALLGISHGAYLTSKATVRS